ncbi:MAG: hypothetical protein ACKVS8_05845 [Phycisphaerales bacterium]
MHAASRAPHPSTHPTTHPAAAALALVAACALPGCFAPQNNSNALGDSATLPALTPDTPTGIRTARVGSPDPPSLAANSFSRDHWAVARFSVPLDSAAHQPTYTPLTLSSTDTLARQRSEYPTADSAMDLSTRDSGGQEIIEGFAAPMWAAFDLGLMPVRALLASPFDSAHAPDNPDRPQKRAPATWSAAMSAPTAADGTSDLTMPPRVRSAPDVPVPEGYWLFKEGAWVPGGWDPATPPPSLPAPQPAPQPAPDAPLAATPSTPTAARPQAPAAVPPGYWVFKDGQWIRTDQPAKP